MRAADAELRAAEAAVAKAQRREESQNSQLAAFERDMARAVGAWDRWVSAQARKLYHDGEEAVGKAVDKAGQIFRRRK